MTPHFFGLVVPIITSEQDEITWKTIRDSSEVILTQRAYISYRWK